MRYYQESENLSENPNRNSQQVRISAKREYIPFNVSASTLWEADYYFIFKQRFLERLVRLRRYQRLRLVDCIPECFTCFKCRNLSRGYLD